jgi:hypothetical protein
VPVTFLLCVNTALVQGNMSKMVMGSIKTITNDSILETQIIPVYDDLSKNEEYRKIMEQIFLMNI